MARIDCERKSLEKQAKEKKKEFAEAFSNIAKFIDNEPSAYLQVGGQRYVIQYKSSERTLVDSRLLMSKHPEIFDDVKKLSVSRNPRIKVMNNG